MASRGQKRKVGTPGKFTASGKPRANMIGNIGLASQAKQHLQLDAKVALEDGKEGLNKWELFRTYVKNISGDKLTRNAYDDASYRYLYERCAAHAYLQPLKDALLEPQTLVNKDIQDSLHWAIQDAWKKKRASNQRAGGSTDEAEQEADEDEYELPETPAPRRRRTVVLTPTSPIAAIPAPKAAELVSVQFRLLDPSEQPPNDYCGAAWADARVRWWTVVERGASFKTLVTELYQRVPKGRVVLTLYGSTAPAPLVVESTPTNLAGCPEKDDVVKLDSEGSTKAFWMLSRRFEKPVIVGVLCPSTASPPEDAVRLQRVVASAVEAYEEIGEEDDSSYYVADPDHEGKEVRHGKIRERIKLRNFPTTKKAADRTLDTIMRRIIRQKRLYRVVLTKVQERFPGYTPPKTDEESVLYYLAEYHKWTGRGASQSPSSPEEVSHGTPETSTNDQDGSGDAPASEEADAAGDAPADGGFEGSAIMI